MRETEFEQQIVELEIQKFVTPTPEYSNMNRL